MSSMAERMLKTRSQIRISEPTADMVANSPWTGLTSLCSTASSRMPTVESISSMNSPSAARSERALTSKFRHGCPEPVSQRPSQLRSGRWCSAATTAKNAVIAAVLAVSAASVNRVGMDSVVDIGWLWLLVRLGSSPATAHISTPHT